MPRSIYRLSDMKVWRHVTSAHRGSITSVLLVSCLVTIFRFICHRLQAVLSLLVYGSLPVLLLRVFLSMNTSFLFSLFIWTPVHQPQFGQAFLLQRIDGQDGACVEHE